MSSPVLESSPADQLEVSRSGRKLEPTSLHGLAQLMTRIFQGEDLTPLGLAFVGRGDNGDAQALLDLSILLQLRGDEATGVIVQQQALAVQRQFLLDPPVKRDTIRLLAIMAPGNLMTNTPLEFIAAGAGFSLQLLYVAEDLPFPEKLPEHDIAIVALSELDRNLTTLDYIKGWINLWPRPVLNLPENISVLGRDLICRQLQNTPGINMPLTIRASRSALYAVASASGSTALTELIGDGDFPVIIRPFDSHAGKGLEKLDRPEALDDYLSCHKGEGVFVSRYVDYRNQDNQFRKYRIVFIDGQPELSHMAVSDHWMVHYGIAGMEKSETKRCEESDAVGNFKRSFTKRHAAAMKTLYETVGLDYFGIDCSESREGKLLIFEVCASLYIHAMDSTALYPYKRPQMQKIFDRFLAMLQRKSQRI